jgi:predicted ABC-type transport system involved in lysophospholipase L1 biosynthesis ATPase subunit
LKKTAQKLLFNLGLGQRNQHGPNLQSFFATFCSQKVALLTASQQSPNG